MAKGVFSQGFVLLTRAPIDVRELAPFLTDFAASGGVEEDGRGSEAALRIPFHSELSGFVSVDVFPRPWPDEVADPSDSREASLCGSFGPWASPGSLARAKEQAFRRPAALALVDEHKACIRIRLAYPVEASDGGPAVPPECEPEEELKFMTLVAEALSAHPAVLCYFNPNGEVLMTTAELAASRKKHAARGVPAFEIWSSVRVTMLREDYCVMDSVGSQQLDLVDLEVGFPSASLEMSEVDGFIRSLSLYLLTNGAVIRDGDTIEGPRQGRWRAFHVGRGLLEPSRPVLRWLAAELVDIPAELLLSGTGGPPAPEVHANKRPWWKLW
jgi:Domain of unknown function (DUF4261)